MFREMRRKRQALCREECERILREGKTGVLALGGDDGYPYALPINYVFDGADIYFHCAREGHKLDSIARCDKASFCVVDKDDVVPEKYTTFFKSVIVFGRMSVINDEEAMRRAAFILAKKYCPDETDAGIKREIERELPALCILKLSPEHTTGKQCVEFLKNG